MNRRSVAGLIAVLSVLALPAASLAATTVSNGSFEKNVSVGSFQTLPTNSTAIDGWTVGAGSVDWIGAYWQHADGAKSLDMNGLAPGSVTQELATTPGNLYVVSFYLAGNPTCGSASKTLSVSATGSTAAHYSFSTTGMSRTSMGWSLQTYSFSGTTASTVLTFASTTSGTCGPALDMVTISETAPAVPPTAEECKKNGWQTMHDDAGTPFRNQGDCVSYFATDGRNKAAGTP